MSVQYLYILQKLILPTSARDGQGNFVQGGSEIWVDVCECRNENGSQKKFTKEDGTYLQATHKIYCPQGTEALSAGQKIRVVEAGNVVRLTGQVLYSSKDPLDTKVWV
ncbi:MAG TPA: hypothetical protein VGE24_07755 [Emticicia sp.]